MKINIPYGALEGCRFPLVPLGAMANFTSGWTPSSKNPAYYGGVNKWATIADLNSRYISDTRQRISDVAVRDAGYPKLSNPGDLLFSFKLSVGMASIVSSPMYTNEAIATFRPSRYLDAGFAYYAFPVFLSAAARPNIYGAPLLSASLISRARVPRLSLMEQRRIADYLDDEVREMDTLIADLEELVDNLVRRKQVLLEERINRQGGTVPVSKAKLLVGIATGEGDTQDALDDGEYPFYVRSDTVRSTDRWTHRGPAVLTSGDGAGVGKIFHFAQGRFRAHQRVYVLNNFHGVDPKYFFWCFKCNFPKQVEHGGAMATVESVRMNMVADTEVPIPSIRQQCETAMRLDRETAEMDFLIKEATELIENLKARKTELITEVVTGRKKI